MHDFDRVAFTANQEPHLGTREPIYQLPVRLPELGAGGKTARISSLVAGLHKLQEDLPHPCLAVCIELAEYLLGMVGECLFYTPDLVIRLISEKTALLGRPQPGQGKLEERQAPRILVNCIDDPVDQTALVPHVKEDSRLLYGRTQLLARHRSEL